MALAVKLHSTASTRVAVGSVRSDSLGEREWVRDDLKAHAPPHRIPSWCSEKRVVGVFSGQATRSSRSSLPAEPAEPCSSRQHRFRGSFLARPVLAHVAVATDDRTDSKRRQANGWGLLRRSHQAIATFYKFYGAGASVCRHALMRQQQFSPPRRHLAVAPHSSGHLAPQSHAN